MTRFLRTDDGKLISAERVEYIKEVKGEAVAVFRKGDVSATLTGDLDEAEHALAPVVATASGYICLHYQGEGEGGPIIDRTPVVA